MPDFSAHAGFAAQRLGRTHGLACLGHVPADALWHKRPKPRLRAAVEVAMREIARSEEGADFLRRWQRLESRFRHSAL